MAKSPFPGMNPYLESSWGDVHTRLMTYASDQLQPQLPPHLRARVEEHVHVEEEAERTGEEFYPDVAITERTTGPVAGAASTSSSATEPLVIPYDVEPETERWIEIVDTRSGHRVVTAIEVLSPFNKYGRGFDAYSAKQRHYDRGGVNLVEIDLLRAGTYAISAPQSHVPAEYQAPYRICVSRVVPRRRELYRATLREPLPRIRIPLRRSDPDAVLDLQQLVDDCYERGGYDSDIDYSKPPIPPLASDDATWAEQLLTKFGRR